jgi:hypothetical protein
MTSTQPTTYIAFADKETGDERGIGTSKKRNWQGKNKWVRKGFANLQICRKKYISIRV